MTRAAGLTALAACVVLVAGCGSTPVRTPAAAPTPHSAKLTVTVEPWTLPYPLAREAAVPVGDGKVLVAGGMNPDLSSSARAYRLTLASGDVQELPDLPVDVHDVAGGFYAGLPAVYGGGNSSEQATVQQYDQLGWHVVTKMPTTRSDLSVVVLDNTTYVLGGYDGNGQPLEVLSQTGSENLQSAGYLAAGTRYAASAVIGSDIYLLGGEVSNAELDTVQRFDTKTGVTSVVAHLPVALGHASAVVLGKRILLVGGRVSPDQGTTAMWWFDPATKVFSKAGDLPAPVTDAAVVTSPDRHTAWILGGESPQVRDQVIRVAWS